MEFNAQQYAGTLAAGEGIPLAMLEYFALIEGTGLQIVGRTRGAPVDIAPFELYGDGSGPVGVVRLYNPTGAPVAYKLKTQTVKFDPKSLASPVSVSISGATATVPVSATGAAAHDAPVSGNPLLVAAEARATERAAVATGDVARLVADLVGRLLVQPHAPGELALQAISAKCAGAGGEAQLAAAAGAGVRNHVVTLLVSNDGAVATDWELRDGAGGAALFAGHAPANSVVPLTFRVPVRGTANTALVLHQTAAATLRAAMTGYVGA